MGKLDLLLGRQLESYQKEDYPPTIVQPLPVNLIQALDTATQGTYSRNIAISNLTWVALFFLLYPGEYCKDGTDTAHHPFRIRDTQFFIGHQPYNYELESNDILTQADFFSLLFTT